jgi:hypothetical protein
VLTAKRRDGTDRVFDTTPIVVKKPAVAKAAPRRR